jgi:hypothetical protein
VWLCDSVELCSECIKVNPLLTDVNFLKSLCGAPHNLRETQNNVPVYVM